MKKILLALFCVTMFSTAYSQSNEDIANVYIKRANKVIEESIDYKEALILFEKAMKYMDTVTSPKVASLGAIIYFELEDYKTAKEYAKQYFLVAKNKKSEKYLEQLDLFVTINEELELQLERERKLEEERKRKAKELKRIDSLKNIWKNKSLELSVTADSIYSFNKNNIAVFNKKGKFGIINDKAEVLIEANEYSHFVSFDGFILLMNKEKEPSKIYYFNTNSLNGSTLPNPSDFNSLSTHYGEVMLPRGNGRLVTYPNNSFAPLVYDLNENKIVRVANLEDVLKSLKKNDRIRKYKKEGEVKINKKWYDFGGHLGGGIHPLYFDKNYKVNAFLCSIDGTVLYTDKDYDYIGAFFDNKFEAVKAGKRSWINQNGTKVSDAKDKLAKYEGNSKVVKLENGVYQIFKNGIIVKGNQTLEKLPDFLRKFNKN